MTQAQQVLIEKIATLPPQRLAEVEDFVDFLRAREAGSANKASERDARDAHLAAQAARASEPAFARVWENDEDAAYDRL